MSRNNRDNNKKKNSRSASWTGLLSGVLLSLFIILALISTALTAFVLRDAPAGLSYIINPLIPPASRSATLFSAIMEDAADFVYPGHTPGLDAFRLATADDPRMTHEVGFYKIIMAPITYDRSPASGNGLSMMIQTPNGRTIMIDGGMQAISPGGTRLIHGPGSGEFDNLERWLDAQTNGQVDLWILTHPHNDHVRSAAAIIHEEKIRIELLMAVDYPKKLHDEQVFDENEQQSTFYYKAVERMEELRRYSTIRAGFELTLDGVRVEFLNAYNEDMWRENDSSAVLRFSFEGSTHTLLVLGDIQEEAAERLIERYADKLDVTIVQLAHHGLDALTDLYDKIMPVYGLVSAGPMLAENPNVQENSRYLVEHFDSKLFWANEEWTVFQLSIKN